MVAVFILAGIIVVISIISFFMEPKITASYKAEGIYGRVYAYFAIAFAVAVPLIIIYAIMGAFKGIMLPIFLVFMLIFGAAAVFMYLRVFKKAPAHLKHRCLIDLTISGFGTAFRVSLFVLRIFIKSWFSLTMPTEARLESGQNVYVFPDGTAYNPATGKMGDVVDTDTIRWR